MSELDPVVVIGLGNRCVLRVVLCARYMAFAVEDQVRESQGVTRSLIMEPEQHWSMKALHPATQEDIG